jgi:hypothetical protein
MSTGIEINDALLAMPTTPNDYSNLPKVDGVIDQAAFIGIVINSADAAG